LFTLLTFLTSCGQTPTDTAKKEAITILRYGLPGPDLYEYNEVARKYNFKLISVAGCIVSPQLSDSVVKHNKMSYEKLDKLNGANWQDKYKKDVQESYSRDTTMVNVLKKEKFIQDQYVKEHKHGNGLIYLVDSALTENIYRINVIGYLDTTSTLVSFFRVVMDYDKLKIISRENNVLPLEIEKEY